MPVTRATQSATVRSTSSPRSCVHWWYAQYPGTPSRLVPGALTLKASPSLMAQSLVQPQRARYASTT